MTKTMISKSRKIRNEYRFARPLDESEAESLAKLILWRKGSSVTRDESGNAIGVICHPDDLSEFRKQLRQRGIRIGIRATADLIEDKEFRERTKRIVKQFRVDYQRDARRFSGTMTPTRTGDL